MKRSDIYGIVALVGLLGLFITAGAQTLSALILAGVPSATVALYGAIKHYQHYEIGD
jgi:xanthosine utilization system XapX-like protein